MDALITQTNDETTGTAVRQLHYGLTDIEIAPLIPQSTYIKQDNRTVRRWSRGFYASRDITLTGYLVIEAGEDVDNRISSLYRYFESTRPVYLHLNTSEKLGYEFQTPDGAESMAGIFGSSDYFDHVTTFTNKAFQVVTSGIESEFSGYNASGKTLYKVTVTLTTANVPFAMTPDGGGSGTLGDPTVWPEIGEYAPSLEYPGSELDITVAGSGFELSNGNGLVFAIDSDAAISGTIKLTATSVTADDPSILEHVTVFTPSCLSLGGTSTKASRSGKLTVSGIPKLYER